jgi:hypothetical protein
MRKSRPPLFKWQHFEPAVITCAVGWYLRFSLSYRHVEELLTERGLPADHTTIWRWVQSVNETLQQSIVHPVHLFQERVGRVMTAEQLHGMGLLAEPEPIKAHITPARVSPANYDRPWPSYQITLSRTRPKRNGTGPDRSVADFPGRSRL